jgi:hypothetical protein
MPVLSLDPFLRVTIVMNNCFRILSQLGDALNFRGKGSKSFHGPSGHKRPWILKGFITINYFFSPANHLNWYSRRPLRRWASTPSKSLVFVFEQVNVLRA